MFPILWEEVVQSPKDDHQVTQNGIVICKLHHKVSNSSYGRKHSFLSLQQILMVFKFIVVVEL